MGHSMLKHNMAVVCTALALAVLLSSLGAAKASPVTIDFWFSSGDVSQGFGGGNWGNTAGTVHGRIFGLDSNGSNQLATDIQIFSAPAALGLGYPFDIENYAAALGQYIVHNSFHLVNGVVQADSVFQIYGGAFDLLLGGVNTGINSLASTNGYQVGNSFGYAGVTFAQTPLPAALPLFVTGLGALGLLGWRRKRKAAALAAI